MCYFDYLNRSAVVTKIVSEKKKTLVTTIIYSLSSKL